VTAVSSGFDHLVTMPSMWAEAAEEHARIWVRRHGLVRSQRAGERFDKTAAGDLTARVYSTAVSPTVLTAAAEWISWLFLIDDQLDEGEVGKDPAAAQRRLAPLADVLIGKQPGRPADDGPLPRALADVWLRIKPTMPATWQHRFTRHAQEYLRGCVWEATNRAQGCVPPAEEFVPNRRAAGAIWPSLDLLEYVTGAPLPEVVHADLLFRELRTAAADVVCWTDDVFTLEKERARGDFHNFVAVLEETTGCATTDAQHLVEELIDLRLADFHERARRLPDRLMRMGVDEQVLRAANLHVTGLRDWMRGHLDWGLRTDRYHCVELTVEGAAPTYLERL
jgi:hypothetical protein